MITKNPFFSMLLAVLLVFWAVMPVTVSANETGIAAYYSDVFHGRKTASGELYDKNALTAAHNQYPFGTRLRVTNLENSKSVTVKVNDRGSHTKGRIIDLSRRAADVLGFVKQGVTKVSIEILH